MSSEGSLASQSSGARDDSQAAGTNPGDVVAMWELRLNDGPHKVTFEHGTTSGKRVILVDGIEVQYSRWSKVYSIHGSKLLDLVLKLPSVCG